MERPQRTHALTRNDARKKSNVRLVRTVVLGAGATVAALFWLGDQYGIEREVMLDYLWVTLLFTGGLVIFGALGAVALSAIKRWLR